MKRGLVIVVALSSCGPHSVGPLQPRPTPPATVARCEPSAPLPELDARFAPEVTGSLALVAARGDMRLSAPAGFVVAWSADSALVGFVRETDVTVWRVSDGTFVDRMACPGFANGTSELAHSADERWLAITHIGGPNHDISRVVWWTDRTTWSRSSTSRSRILASRPAR